jgi:hypothetical protein
VRFNIFLGANGPEPTQEELDQACKDANVCLHETISDLDLRLYSIFA